MSQKLQYELSARDSTKAALRSFKKGFTIWPIAARHSTLMRIAVADVLL